MNPNFIIPAAVFFLYGFCAIVAQLLCLQELLIVFGGHELFLGFSLAAWMGWVGTGSWYARNRSSPSLQMAVACLTPVLILDVVIIRLSKCLFGFGMMIGLFPMLILTAILLAPLGFITGILFTRGCAWASQRFGFSLGAAYLWDTLGSAAGGLISCLVLAGNISPAGIVLTAAVLAFTLGILVLPQKNRLLFAVLMAILSLGILIPASFLPRWTRSCQWRGYTILDEKASRYSHLLLGQIGSLTNLFGNGTLECHFPDPAAYEELVHWPLLLHPDPKNICIIGGAAGGSLSEILKHPVTRVDYIELDPAVINILRPALSAPDIKALDDRRVHILHCDGRRWLSQATTQVDRFDVILLQLPEPTNAQINRFYTLEAFRAIHNRLKPDGIFCFAIPSSENYLSGQTVYFNSCIYQTLKAVFPAVEIVAGNPMLLLASNHFMPLDAAELSDRYRQRNLSTQAVVPSYFPIKLDARRREYLAGQLNSVRWALLNRDYVPLCYAYTYRLWLSKFASPLYFAGILGLIGLLIISLRMLWRHRAQLTLLSGPTALFALGCAGMVYETVLILAFQSIHGYVYWQLGGLFAAFMLGLAAGSAMGLRRPPAGNAKRTVLRLRILLAATGLQGIALTWILPWFQKSSPAVPWFVPFGILLAVTGIWLGIAFPMTARANTSAGTTGAAKTAGTLYAADLWGAALGAVFTSAFLIPLAGLCATTAITGTVVLAAAFLLPRRV